MVSYLVMRWRQSTHSALNGGPRFAPIVPTHRERTNLRSHDLFKLIDLVQQQPLLRLDDLLAGRIVKVGYLLELERVPIKALARLGGGNDLGRHLVPELAARARMCRMQRE